MYANSVVLAAECKSHSFYLKKKVLDTARKWLLSEVLNVRGRLIEIHYLDYPHAWDEWIEISSPRYVRSTERRQQIT